MLEAELDFAGQARRRAGEYEAPLGKAAQRVADVGRAQCRSNRTFPEDSSHHRRLLEDATFREWQCLDPGDEHRLDGVRNCGTARFGEVADRLLQKIRVAFGPRDDRRAQLGRERARREQRIHQAGRIVDAQRWNLDRDQAVVRQEAGLTTQECRAGGRDEKERAVEHRRDNGQGRDQRRSGPVEVLDDEDRAAPPGVRTGGIGPTPG